MRVADHILVFDSGSQDETMMLARQAGAEVIQQPFRDYASQRNAALAAVQGRTEWVLFVDADERVTPELAAEIREKIQLPDYGGWRIPRHNYIFGRLTLGAGWYPDYQTRLLHRQNARYDPGRPVHEEVILDGEAGYMQHPIIHHNYRDVAQFIAKQEQYTDFEAGIRYGKGLRPRPWTYLTGPLRHFWWRFVTLKGYGDGLHGLRDRKSVV